MGNNSLTPPTTPLPLIAKKGVRGGYLQLAFSQAGIEHYAQASSNLFEAAVAWATWLESQPTIKRAYWVIFSEAVPQLHIHLFPRYDTDTVKGEALFATRDNPTDPTGHPHPPWTSTLEQGLIDWSTSWNVTIVA
jgi:hypothetical protein